VAQLGSALRSGRRGRWFESSHPDKNPHNNEGFVAYMYFTYILKSEKTDKLYIGHTENIERRLLEHNSNQSKSTKNNGPWKLIFTKEFNSRSEAMKFELKLKSFKNKNYLLNNLQNFSR
jgi:putative endonuclease